VPTFAEFVAGVYELTVRPDLVADTAAAVKSATLWAHTSDFYPKDIYEVPVSWNSPAVLQEFEYRTHIPRWRALKYFRHYDFTADMPGDFFTVLDPVEALDRYYVQRSNIAYMAGELLKFRGHEEFSGGLLGCYIYPDVAPETYKSWIAVEDQFIILYKAAATVLRTTGFVERAKNLEAEAKEHLMLLSRSNILAVGE